MTKGFQDIIWLAGQVFLWPDFVEQVDKKGLEAIFAECPYGDLTAEQKAAYTDAFTNPKLRKVVEQWWKAYQKAREEGEIVKAGYWY